MRTHKILIIEDDKVDRELLKASLRESSNTAFEFAEEGFGNNAVARCREFRPDCILLDLNLPDISGLDLLRNFIGNRTSAPVVVVTGFGNEQIAVSAMKAGAIDYVVKNSVTPESLIRTVENAIDKHQLRIELDRQRRSLAERNVELQAAIQREQAANLVAEAGKERFRMLTEAIPQVVWTAMHPDGGFDHVSQKWSESTGMSAEAALGDGWLNAVHPQDRDRVAAAWREARENKSRFELECRLGAHQGKYRWHLAIAVPQYGKNSVLRWFGTFTEIEDRRRAEQALLQRQKLESTGLLAGGIAHDFNNLLVGILGNVSYALDVLPESHEVRPTLETALQASERAAMLTRQMLAYAGKGKFLIERVNLPELVRSTCNLIRASIPKLVHLNVETAEDVPAIEADASQIQQIIMNLVINAAESIGEEKSGIVTVRTDTEELDRADPVEDIGPGVYSVLEVVDTGSGMTEELRSRIFEPFFTTKFTGRGLGLAAVMGVVRSSKGAIRVRSAPGEGTTFRVLLPATQSAAKSPDVAPSLPKSISSRGVILIIDDEEFVRRTVTISLERAGYAVYTSVGGVEGVARVRENSSLFDLVLLDMNMPDLSGEDTLRQLRLINPSLPVAVCSGYSEIEITNRLGGQAITGILQKPFTTGTLVEKVAGFVASRAHQA